MGSRQDVARHLAPLASLAAGALVWEFSARAGDWQKLPTFSSVVAAAVEMTLDGRIAGPLTASLSSLVVGLGAAIVFGTLCGFLMARSYTVEHMMGIYFDALMAAPTLIYVPILFAVFGVTRGAQVATILFTRPLPSLPRPRQVSRLRIDASSRWRALSGLPSARCSGECCFRHRRPSSWPVGGSGRCAPSRGWWSVR